MHNHRSHSAIAESSRAADRRANPATGGSYPADAEGKAVS